MKTGTFATTLLLVFAMASPGSADLPKPAPAVASGVVTKDVYPAHIVTFAGGVRGIPGLVYSQPAGFRALTLDIYMPPGSIKRSRRGFPLVVYIHGGGWRSGDAENGGAFVDFPGVLAALSAKGYVVASVEYRLSGEAKMPAQIEDVRSAIRWLRANASRFGIDPARAAVWGISAGGHLAALAAVSCSNAAPRVSDCVQAAVSWSGTFDFGTIARQARRMHAMPRGVAGAPGRQLLGCDPDACKPGQIAAASPVTYVDGKSPPMLLIAGTKDTTVPYLQTLEMADKLSSAGARRELILLPGVNHYFVGKTPDQTRYANLKALDATFWFLDDTIGDDPSGAR